MRQIRIYICVVVAAILAGCFKDEAYDTNIILRPAQQQVSGGDFIDLEGVVAYAFAVDTTYFEVKSYADALNGIVTNKTSNEVAPPIAVATPYGDGQDSYIGAMQMRVQQEDVMLLAVDTENEDYAYTNYTVGLNLPTTYISLPFRPWKEGAYKQGTWWYVVAEALVLDTDGGTDE